MTSPAGMLRYGRRVAVAALMTLLFAGAARQIRVFDPDLWWHLRTGQIITELRSIPRGDIYSFTTPGKEWVAHEWLAEVLLWALYRAAGAGALVIFFALIITLAFWLTYRRCAAPPLISGAALAVGALASMPTWGVRPQMLTLLMASVFLFLLGDYARAGRSARLWWLIPLMALWANLHGGFALGLVLIILTAAGLVLDAWAGTEPETKLWPRLRPLCILLAACAVAGLLTPHGVRLYSYPLETLASHAQQTYIMEWNSPNFQKPNFLPLAFLMLATFSVLALSPRRPRLSELLLLSAMCYAALRSGRHIPFFSLAAVPLLAEHARLWFETYPLGRSLTAPERPASGAQIVPNLLLLVVPAMLAVVITAQVIREVPATAVLEAPVAAVDFIKSQRPPGPIFNTYGWGGYLIWRLYPEHRVYIDGRADVYGDAFFDEFIKVYRAEESWQGPFERHGVRAVLVEPRAPLATALRQRQEWAKVFEDEMGVVFYRN